MTYFITAHTNDKARLIVSETRTTSSDIAAMVKDSLSRQGFIVSVKSEG